MGLKDLTTASMVTITGALVDPERERPLFAKYPRLLPWLGDIEEAHKGLYEIETRSPSSQLAAMNERATLLDSEHDRKARGIHEVLTGIADLTDDPEMASRLITARDQLFPSGRSIVNRSYLDEAGEASLMESRLSEESRNLLSGLQVQNTVLSEHVHAFKQIASELGKLEAERVRLAKDEKAQVLTTLGKARNAWISAVSSLIYVIKREKDLTDADRRRLLEPLETALAKAAAKKARAKEAESDSATE